MIDAEIGLEDELAFMPPEERAEDPEPDKDLVEPEGEMVVFSAFASFSLRS